MGEWGFVWQQTAKRLITATKSTRTRHKSPRWQLLLNASMEMWRKRKICRAHSTRESCSKQHDKQHCQAMNRKKQEKPQIARIYRSCSLFSSIGKVFCGLLGCGVNPFKVGMIRSFTAVDPAAGFNVKFIRHACEREKFLWWRNMQSIHLSNCFNSVYCWFLLEILVFQLSFAFLCTSRLNRSLRYRRFRLTTLMITS